MQPHDTTNDIPYGFCKCGCGQKTTIAQQTYTARGWIQGEPIRYISGHQHRTQQYASVPVNPGSLCMCGCGQPAPIAKKTERKCGHVKGQPKRFIAGHQQRVRIKPPAKKPPKPTLEECFWANVDRRSPDACWLWRGRIGKQGYGILSFEGEKITAHRVSWILHFGPIPEGMFVCHHCDVNYPVGDLTNRSCVNPAHLFVGRAVDNVRDMDAKGRRVTTPRPGESHHAAKLTENDVREIRYLRAQGEMGITLAARFGVSAHAISNIVRRKTWKHIE